MSQQTKRADARFYRERAARILTIKSDGPGPVKSPLGATSPMVKVVPPSITEAIETFLHNRGR